MFSGSPTEIQGFEIPYNGTWFLIVLGIHVLAGLTCVIAGLVAILADKRHGRHTRAGSVYYWGLCIVFVTASLIAVSRWQKDYYLFILGLLSFAFCFIGRRSYRKHWKNWSIYHVTGMSLSYIFLLIAFYVDNGRFLPVWKNLSPVLYWVLPLLIGIPIMIKTLLTHPLTRNYFRNKS